MNKPLRYVLFVLLWLGFYTIAQAQNCTVNAGINTTVCPGSSFTLNGQASGLFTAGGTATWSQVSGPSVTISPTVISGTSATATVSGYTSNVNYVFRLTAKCTDGSLVYQDVTYVVSSLGIANAGPDNYACPGNYVLQGSPLGTDETGIWTKIAGTGPDPNPATINNPNATITFVANSDAQSATYRWTVSKITGGNTCTSFDDVEITNLGTRPVNAGGDLARSCYNVTTSAQLDGSFAGTNSTYGQSAKWTLVSGPSNPAISNTAVRNPTVSNLVAGTYVFRYTVTGPCFSGSDDVSVVVDPASQSITNAGGGTTQTFCDGRTSVVLNGPKALYANEVMLWEKSTGPGTPIFSATNTNSVTVSGLTTSSGTNYEFRYTIRNTVTNCQSSGIYNVRFRGAPTIAITTPNANPHFLGCNVSSLAINYTVTNGTATQYALISAPVGSTRQTTMGGLNNWVTAPASGTNLTGFDKIGSYVLRYRRNTDNGTGGCADAYAEITIVVSASPTASNGGTKQVLACNVFNTNLAGNLPTSGIGKWSQVSGPNTSNIVNPLANTTAVNGLINGTYLFRWIVSGGEGACTNTQADVEVVVSAPSPTTSAAGLPQAVCNSTPVLLNGNQPVLNEVGTWTVVRTAGSVAAPEAVFSPNANSPKAVVNGLIANTSYTFTWTINNACGTSSSSVVVDVSATAGAKQAVANIAGNNTCLASGTNSIVLAGNQPTNGEVGTWILLAGPNNPAFTAGQYNTPVTGLVNGTYEFQWQLARNGCAATTSNIKFTISAPVTTANAGTAQNICGTSVNLNGNQPSVGTGTWTQIGGPGGAVITNPSLRTSAVTGLTEGRYIFRWTVANESCAASTSDVTINVSQPPSAAMAGADFEVCNLTSTALNASAVAAGTGYWSVISGPNIPTILNLNNPQTAVTGLIFGKYTFRWTTRGGIYCTPSTDDVVVSVTSNANAGADQNLCALTSATLTGTNQSTGTWTQSSGPAATVTTTSANSAIVSGLTPGSTYQFTYTIAATVSCPMTSDAMTIVVSAQPSQADAGPDQNYCSLSATPITSVNLAATAPLSGTGSWNVIERPSGSPVPTFSLASSATSTFSNLTVGTYMLEWIVSGGNCTGNNSNRDIVKINIYAEPSAADAGPDQNAACTSNVILTGNTPAVGLGTWSIVSQPLGSSATFGAVNSPNTVVNNTITGTYVFRWTISNGSPTCTSKTDEVAVNVTSEPTTVASVGANQQVCNAGFPGTATTGTVLTGNNYLAGETGTWTFVSGPTTLTAANFNNVNSATATVSGLAQGTYVLRWTIVPTSNPTAADCRSSADLTISVFNQPTVAVAGTDQVICLGSSVTLAANTISSGIGTWSVVSRPAAATFDPVFSDLNSPIAVVNGFVAGNYTLRWTSSNGGCTNSTSEMKITVKSCDIAIAKATSTPVLQTDGSYNVTLTFNVRNNGDEALSNIQVEDDLTLTFPSPKTYTVTSISTVTGSTLSVNSAFNGNADKNLLNASTSTLAAGSQQTITLVLNVKLI